MRNWWRDDSSYGVNFVNFVGNDPMKRINVWPMLTMLIVIVLLVIWLRP